MKRKGFTLVELLIVIVILAIITGISIPLIRNIREKNQNKEYTNYAESIEYSAKLYIDSHKEDLFVEDGEEGCVIIEYDDLERKGLLKDIGIDDVSCNNANTFVAVIKKGNEYTYKVNLMCTKEGEEIYKAETVNKEDCSGSSEAPIATLSTSNNVSSTQIGILTIRDRDDGITGYYFGNKNPKNTNVEFTSVAGRPKELVINDIEITKAGTYYLVAKDVAGNRSKVIDKKVYKTELELNGGVLDLEEVITLEGNSITLPSPTKEGYNFIGWYEDNTYTKIVEGAYTPTSSKKLYAKWTIITYSISYATNGGRLGGNSPTIAEYNEIITLNSPTKTFIVNIDANTQGASVSSGGSAVTSASSVQTFAGWTASNLNTSTAKYGSAANPTTTWNGTTKIGSGYATTYFKNLRNAAGTVTLTANWAAVAVTLPTVAKTGYSCNFNTASNGTGTTYNSGANYPPSTTSGSTTLYVRCSPNTYTITLNNQSATSAGTTAIYEKYATGYYTNSGATTQMTTSANKITLPSRTCYTFGGYYTSTGGSGTQYIGTGGFLTSSASTTNFSAAGTLYAKWTAQTSTITLNQQSGSGGTTSVTGTYGSAMPSATAPTRTGYTFGGYYTSTGGGGTQYYSASMGSVRNWDKCAATTLYAKWTTVTSTVTLDRQSGTGGTASVTATYGSAMPSATAPTRTGYTFGGYYTGTGGSGTQYYNASMGSVRNWDKTSATTLYAKWSSPLKVGDYFTLIPDKSTFSITSDMTGRDETQTINPSQLTLWRVISLDGGIVAVSEYVSSQSVCLYGKKGYANLVGTLQTVAAQYSKSGYTIATRMMGYNGQTLITQLPSDNYSSTCSGDISTTPSTTTGTGREYNSGLRGDTLYLKDYQLVSNLYKSDTATYGRFGLNAYIVGTSTKQKYWLASRVIGGGSSYDNDVLVGKSKSYAGRVVTASNSNNISLSIVLSRSSVSTYDCFRSKATEGSACASVRPIITLSSSVSAVAGSGTKSNPYTITN